MGFRRLFLGGLLALLGPASPEEVRSDELDLRDAPETPPRAVPAALEGHRVAGPGFLVWQESPLEADSWARALNPPRPLATACGLCGHILGADGVWRTPETVWPPPAELSHGFCPACARQHHPDLFDDL